MMLPIAEVERDGSKTSGVGLDPRIPVHGFSEVDARTLGPVWPKRVSVFANRHDVSAPEGLLSGHCLVLCDSKACCTSLWSLQLLNLQLLVDWHLYKVETVEDIPAVDRKVTQAVLFSHRG